jgi:hypothetical protein
VGLKVEKLASVLGCVDERAAFGRLVSHWDRPTDVVRGATDPRTLTHRPSCGPTCRRSPSR